MGTMAAIFINLFWGWIPSLSQEVEYVFKKILILSIPEQSMRRHYNKHRESREHLSEHDYEEISSTSTGSSQNIGNVVFAA